jgi:hypothetical protein
MTPVVKLRDVVDAMDTITDGLHVYLNKHTGEFVMISNEDLDAVGAGKDLTFYADWQRELIQNAQEILDTDDYLRLPSQFDIHEYSIIERFCYEIKDAELRTSYCFKSKAQAHFGGSNMPSIATTLPMIGIAITGKY